MGRESHGGLRTPHLATWTDLELPGPDFSRAKNLPFLVSPAATADAQLCPGNTPGTSPRREMIHGLNRI